jgi:hypothetical protein
MQKDGRKPPSPGSSARRFADRGRPWRIPQPRPVAERRSAPCTKRHASFFASFQFSPASRDRSGAACSGVCNRARLIGSRRALVLTIGIPGLHLGLLRAHQTQKIPIKAAWIRMSGWEFDNARLGDRPIVSRRLVAPTGSAIAPSTCRRSARRGIRSRIGFQTGFIGASLAPKGEAE